VTRTRVRRAGWWVPRLLILTAIALLGLVALGWWGLQRSVPRLEGQMRLAGLSAPVEILFDAYAVPHIYARDAEDAWLTLGYLHARERLWQMELYRRASGGRLSEVLGPATVRVDRRFVGLGLRRAALDEWNTATPLVRGALEKYSAGVNAAVAAMGRYGRPPEFLALGIEPEPWTPVDSLAVGRVLTWRLAENRMGELVRGRLTNTIGAAAAGRLMGTWPAGAPAILEPGAGAAPPIAVPPRPRAVRPPTGEIARLAVPQALPAGLEWLDVSARAGASNSWVLSPARTATGRPLLANDPHLAVEMPSIWYEAHLVASGLDVAGVTLPSTPFVIIGHNARLAWGLTNAGIDVQDFYLEEVDMTRRRYLHRGEWLPLQSTTVEIGVRGHAPVRHEYFSTRHGALLYTEDDWETPPDLAARRGRVSPRPLAMRWETRGEVAAGFQAINRAANWTEFLAGVRRLTAPSQNFVYADVGGHIGYALSGRLPIRAGGDGGVPARGWTGEQEWTGMVPAERMPALLDPSGGQVVTANAEIDRGWSGVMTRDWTAPFRTMRITERLAGRNGLDPAALTAIQIDVQSRAAEPLLAAVETASKSAAYRSAEADARTGIDRLRLWDRHVDGRPVVTLYQAFVRALWRRTFADDMDGDTFDALFEYGASERYVGLHAIVEDAAAPWWDDIVTVDRRETRDDIVLLAAADAVIHLRTKFGSERNWAWDRLHSVTFRHALGAGGFLLDWFFSRGPVPQPGDSWTVRKASVDDRQPYRVIEVASYRQVLDVGDWDKSLAINTTGQSGHPLSPHYFDQNPLWSAGAYRSVPFTRAAVEQARTRRVLVTP
jgi:penicillin G amidase